MYSLRTEEEVRDFVRGCVFMGTGGGGPPEVGLKFLLEDIKEGREIKWMSVSEIPDDAWTCAPYYMGSIAPLTSEARDKIKKMGLMEEKVERVLINAVRGLEEFDKIKIGGIVPIELGGINTPAPLDTATRMGIPIIDGDYAGRAVPEICQASPVIYNKKLCPIVSCDKWGNTVIIKDAINYDMAEALGKAVSTTAFVICGQCGLAMTGKEMKEVVIPGTLTQCFNIGKAIREAREKGDDPVNAAIKVIDGQLLFRGKVDKKEWEDKEGYMYGTHTMKGVDEFDGHTFKIWFKNENHISWLDDKVYVTSPDLIEVVEDKTAEPVTNTDLKEGDMVAVVGKANERYRTERGLELMGPKHFGFDIDYVSIEERVK